MSDARQTALGLCDHSLEAVAELVRRRELSPVELAEAVLRRIDGLDPRLNAFITVTADLALAEARRAEAEIQAGRYLGPLHGAPISVKDIVDTAGIRTTAGSRILADNVPERDAVVVARLKSAGAVLIGKTNLLEFAYGTVHPDYGPSLNPWSLDHSAGGSSSGSAVAVAAGMGFGSIASDTGGSIRIPAAFCGVVGLKPTYDRVSRDGLIPLSWSTDHVGPIARTVTDAAILLDAIADRPTNSDDRGGRVDPLAIADRPLAGIRIGIDDAYLRHGVDPEVLTLVERALQVFEELGGAVREIELPSPDDVIETLLTIRTPEATAAHLRWLRERPADYSEAVRTRLEAGMEIPAVRFVEALRSRERITRAFLDAFRQVELLVTPTVPVPAPAREHDPTLGKADTGRTASLIRFTGPFNLTGLPAITIPCGFTASGLPVGLQLATPVDAEAALLRMALAYERATPWRHARPETVPPTC